MVPSSGWWKPREHLDQRGLAGAVLAEQAVHLAGADVEVHAVERADAGELLDDAGHLEQAACRRLVIGLLPRRRLRGARPGSGRRRRPRARAAAPPRTAAVKPRVESSTRVPPACGARTPAVQLLLDGRAHPVADLGEVAAEHDRAPGLRALARIAAPMPIQPPTWSSAARVRVSPRSARRLISASRSSRASAGSRTGSSGSAAASSRARRPTTVSQQPTRPQPQRRPPRLDDHVAELAGVALAAAQQPAVGDDAAADADLAEDHQDVLAGRVARARPRRSRRGCPRCRRATGYAAPRRPRSSAPTGTSRQPRLGPTVRTLAGAGRAGRRRRR